MAASPYVRRERVRQERWKASWTVLPEPARAHGTFMGRPHAWLLPLVHAEHSLWAPVRAPLIEHFRARNIAWHEEKSSGYGDRTGPGPSCNLMDSQVACLNFWWGLQGSPDALLAVVQYLAPDAVALVPPDGGPMVEPEWMGMGNPLKERGTQRRRGAYATSADLLIAYEDAAGARHGLLIESKYSERYDPVHRRVNRWGTDRLTIYRHALDADWSPIRSEIDAGELMYEPFDQHLRQQLLAAAMQADPDTQGGFATVRLIHVSPRANRAFHEGVTAPILHRHATVADAWRSVLRDPDTYGSFHYEDLLEVAQSTA